MRWYVSCGNEVLGPLTGTEVAEWLRSQTDHDLVHVRDETASEWETLAKSPFAVLARTAGTTAAPVAPPVAASSSAPKNVTLLQALMVFGGVIFFIYAYKTCDTQTAAVGSAIDAQKTGIESALTGKPPAPIIEPPQQLSSEEQRESARLQAFIDWHSKNTADLLATILPANRKCYDKSDGELFGTCTGMHILGKDVDSYSLNWIKAKPQETLAIYSTNHAINLDCGGLSTTEVRHFDSKWLQLVSFSQVCSGAYWGYLIEHYTAPSKSTKVAIYSADYPKYDKPFGRVLLGDGAPTTATIPPVIAAPLALALKPSMSAFKAWFEGLDVAFEQNTPLADGTPRLIGKHADGLTMVELIGHGETLQRASVMMGLVKEAGPLARNTGAIMIFMRETGWEEGWKWATDSIGKQEVIKHHGVVEYEMQTIPDTGVSVLSAKPFVANTKAQ